MARLFRTAPAVIAWLVALVLVTVTACSSGPAPAASEPTPEPTHQGNTAPVSPDTETVLEVPDGPTVAIPEGAASGEGRLEVAAEADEALESYEGVSGWEIHIDDAELAGQAIVTFPVQLEAEDPLPLVGYRDDATGEYVPVEVELVDGHPTVRTEHFSFWFLQDLRDVVKTISQVVEGLVSPFPNAQRPECSGAEGLEDRIQVTYSHEDILWCVGGNEAGAPVLTVVNREGHTVEFESTSHLVPEPTKLTFSNTVEELVLAAGYAADTSGHNFGLIAPGETKSFTLAGTGRHEIVFDASAASFLGSATRVAAETLASTVGGTALKGVAGDDAKAVEMAAILLQAVENGSCAAALEEAAGPGDEGRSVARLTAVSAALVGCSQKLIEGSFSAGTAFFIGAAVSVLGGVKLVLSGISGIVGTVRGREFLLIDFAGKTSIDDAHATEIVTVRPFEDGTVDNARRVTATSGNCIDADVSTRAGAVKCFYETSGESESVQQLIWVCFLDPSGAPQMACPARDGSWVVVEGTDNLEMNQSYNDQAPEDGIFYRVELTNGGHCWGASGSGPATYPEGYNSWGGGCEVDGGPPLVWYVPEDLFDENNPRLAGISDDGYLQIAAGREGDDPQLYEVARAYR